MFVSENPSFVDFNDTSSLIWEKNGLTYGDWNAGINGDGTFLAEVDITPSNVRRLCNTVSYIAITLSDYIRIIMNFDVSLFLFEILAIFKEYFVAIFIDC